MKTILFALFFFPVLLISQEKKQYKNAADVFTAMQKKYSGGKWYRHFTFTQDIIFYNDSGRAVKKEVWHEASSSPGKLIIKIGSKDSKDGVLLENGKVHVYREGKEPLHRPGIHDLSLAAFDVYFIKPQRTSAMLDSLGYKTEMVRNDTWKGKKALVIGAEKGDSTSRQIWIDAENFYILRIIYQQGKTIMDASFEDYKSLKAENGKTYAVSTKMVFKRNGKPDAEEVYYDIRFPETLSDDIFDPEKFNSVKLP